jgi:hypothetical protein
VAAADNDGVIIGGTHRCGRGITQCLDNLTIGAVILLPSCVNIITRAFSSIHQHINRT